MTRTSADVYAIVAESYDNGNRTAKAISDNTGIPQRTAGRYLSKYLSGIPVDEVRNQGRPNALSRDDVASVAELVREDPMLSSRRLSQLLSERRDVVVSARTVRNYLHQSGHVNSLPRLVPAITDAAKVG